MIDDVILVVLGWLLGTLSPGISDAIGRARRRRAIRRVLATELHELRFMLALVLERMRSKLRTMDQAVLNLVRPILLAYRDNTEDVAILEAAKKLLEKGDAVYIALHNAPSPAGEGSWLLPVPYDAPFLKSRLEDLSLFPPATQQRLLRIVGELHLFNEQVAIVRQAHDRTFDTSLTGENYAANEKNLTIGTEKLAVRAEALIRAINRVLGPDGRPLA